MMLWRVKMMFSSQVCSTPDFLHFQVICIIKVWTFEKFFVRRHPVIRFWDEIKGNGMNDPPVLNVFCDSSWFHFSNEIQWLLWWDRLSADGRAASFEQIHTFNFSISSVMNGRESHFLFKLWCEGKENEARRWMNERPPVESSVFESWDRNDDIQYSFLLNMLVILFSAPLD